MFQLRTTPPLKTKIWQWKITFNRRYIFKWLVFHCHLSFLPSKHNDSVASTLSNPQKYAFFWHFTAFSDRLVFESTLRVEIPIPRPRAIHSGARGRSLYRTDDGFTAGWNAWVFLMQMIFLRILLVTFLGWSSDPLKWFSDLELRDRKVTLNHPVWVFCSPKFCFPCLGQMTFFLISIFARVRLVTTVPTPLLTLREKDHEGFTMQMPKEWWEPKESRVMTKGPPKDTVHQKHQ